MMISDHYLLKVAFTCSKIVCECDGSKPAEEYMATDYYDDLNCMDKQHHTVLY